MSLDKKKIKEKLEKEMGVLLEQLRDMGKLNPKTGMWEATQEDLGYKDTDQNDMADRFEDFESKSSMMDILAARLKNIQSALRNINKETFGICKVCKKEIEPARISANPAARTCKKHLES